MPHRSPGRLALAVCARVLEFPCPAPGIMLQARVVVAFVEEFEHAGEDLGLFVWKVNSFAWVVDVRVCSWRRRWGLRAALVCEDGRCSEDGFVGGEEALFGAYAEHHDG